MLETSSVLRNGRLLTGHEFWTLLSSAMRELQILLPAEQPCLRLPFFPLPSGTVTCGVLFGGRSTQAKSRGKKSLAYQEAISEQVWARW